MEKPKLKHYNNKMTFDIWSRKILKEATSKTIFRDMVIPEAITPQFNKKEIQKWWDAYKYPFEAEDHRKEAKDQLAKWFGEQYDKHIFETLTEITEISDEMLGKP